MKPVWNTGLPISLKMIIPEKDTTMPADESIVWKWDSG
jgi:hypothetical protein